MTGLSIRNLVKSFGGRKVIDNISFDVEEGEFCIVLGPSGCGKSTILRLVAGLDLQDEGSIRIGGSDAGMLGPKERDVAMVFQSYALYPHLTVYDNLAFPLRLRRLRRRDIDTRVQKVASLLGIDDMLGLKPKALSGGQKQRVALGRAIVRSPRLFLFDEPLSNLDARLRSSMRIEIAKLHERLHTTTLYVTHDQTEAMTLGQKIVLIDGGVIQQIGSPREIYEKPANTFVASFIGMPSINFIEGRLAATDRGLSFISDVVTFEPGARPGLENYAGSHVTAGIRPESLMPGGGPVRAELEFVEHLGSETILYLKFAETRIVAKAPADFSGKKGELVALTLDVDGVHFFENGLRVG